MSKQDSEALQTVSRTTPQGDIYEATRLDSNSSWEINFPTGSERFYGGRTEALAEINRIIKIHGDRTYEL